MGDSGAVDSVEEAASCREQEAASCKMTMREMLQRLHVHVTGGARPRKSSKTRRVAECRVRREILEEGSDNADWFGGASVVFEQFRMEP